jgi:hypothetical protein
MATTTTNLGLRKPATTDVVNVSTDINDNMDKIDAAVGFQVVTAFPGTPYIGKGVVRSDQNNRTYIWNGTKWVEIMVLDNIMKYQESRTNTQFNTTSTSFTAVVPEVSLTFVAPQSGAVFVGLTGRLETVLPSYSAVSWEIRNTNVSGTVVHAATEDVKAVMCQGDQFIQATTVCTAPGLTPGNTYYARAMFKTSSNTGSLFFVNLAVWPVLNV